MTMTHKEISAKGGSAKSPKKTKAVAENAKLPRGKWYTSIAYEYESATDGSNNFGAIIVKGQPPKDTQKNHEWFIAHIENHLGNRKHPVKEIRQLASMSMRIK